MYGRNGVPARNPRHGGFGARHARARAGADAPRRGRARRRLRALPRCHRTPLIGERVYVYEGGGMLCELCREVEPGAAASRIVHGPEFGHTLRITDHRAAA